MFPYRIAPLSGALPALPGLINDVLRHRASNSLFTDQARPLCRQRLALPAESVWDDGCIARGAHSSFEERAYAF